MSRARSSLGDALRSLFHIRPVAVPRWPIALQAGLAVAIPIAIATLAGRPELGYQAAAGAFTVLHVSQLPTVERARMLPLIALGLIATAALGVALADSAALTIAGLVAVGILASAVFYAFSLGPPGPLFFVLTYGLSGQIAGALGGAGRLTYLGAVAAGAVFSYLLALGPLALPHARGIRPRRLREVFPGPSLAGEAGELLLRAVVVTVVATALGVFVDPERTYWVVASGLAVVGVAVGRRAAVTRGLHRLVGTAAGAALTIPLVLLHPSGLWLAALLGVLQFLIEIVVVRNYALALLFITPLVLLLTAAATGGMGTAVIEERIVDTLVGALLGAASGLLHRRRAAGIS